MLGKKLARLSPIAVVLLTTAAHAQTQPTSGNPTSSPQQSAQGQVSDGVTTGLTDIVVTAQRREQKLQDIPIAVSAVSGETLKAAGVTNLLQLTTLNPTFNYYTTNGVATGIVVRLRSLGTAAQSAGFDPGVGIFLDGVVTSRTGVALSDLIDVDRVEVLRGPQGTLFGRNTSFGAINIITRKPEFNFGGEVEASYGNYDAKVVRATITGPLSSTVAARLTGGYQKRDGIFKVTSGGRTNSRDRWLLRGQLLWQPSSDLSVRFIGDYSKISDQCCYPALTNGTDPTVQAFSNALGGVIANVPFDAFQINLSSNRPQNSRTTNGGASAELNWNLGPATLTSITAYRRLKSETGQDTDLTGADIFNSDPKFGVKTFTSETRLAGRTKLGGIGLDWLVGGFYIDDKVTNDLTYLTGNDYQRYATYTLGSITGFRLTPQLLAGVPAGTALIGAGVGAHDSFRQNSRGFGIFTHNVFSLTPRFDVTLGVRYSSERKRGSGNLVTDPQFTAFCNILRRAAIFPVNLLSCPFYIAPTGATPGALNFANFGGRRFDHDFSGTARLSYRLDGVLPSVFDKLLVFGGFSRGFKAGGFNLDRTEAVYPTAAAQAAGQPVDDGGFRPERVDSFELGVKATMLDRKLIADVTGFVQKVKDLQSLSFNGVSFVVGNVQKFINTGVEVELVAAPVRGLTLNGGFQHTLNRYPVNQTFLPLLVGLSGTRNSVNAYTFGGAYTVPIPSAGLKATLNGDGRIDSPQTTSGPAYSLVARRHNYDMRLSIARADDGIGLEFWVRNLSNDRTPRIVIQNIIPSNGLIGYPADPRTYGVTGRVRF